MRRDKTNGLLLTSSMLAVGLASGLAAEAAFGKVLARDGPGRHTSDQRGEDGQPNREKDHATEQDET